MREPASKPRGSGVNQAMPRDQSQIFNDAKIQAALREEKKPVEIKSGGEGVQALEKKEAGFELAAGHGIANYELRVSNDEGADVLFVIRNSPFEISSMAFWQYHLTALDIGGWRFSKSVSEHQRMS